MKKILLVLLLVNELYAELYSLPLSMSKETGNLESRKYENLYNTIDYSWFFNIKKYVIFPSVYIEDGNKISDKQISEFKKAIKNTIEKKLNFLKAKQTEVLESNYNSGVVIIDVRVYLDLYNEVTQFYYGLMQIKIEPHNVYSGLIAPANYFETYSIAGFRNNVFSNTKERIEYFFERFRDDFFYINDAFVKEMNMSKYQYKALSTERKEALDNLVKEKKVILNLIDPNKE
ncbi:hypothetical protein QUR79_00460 [Arcobacter cryaerophilus gv. pseudocryaerophilus]|uniref:DUF4468 domain-containing protein n=1 Tax=Arcobacter cryaerophilus gv. pseudocryaerophilus TaxID=2933791 RepID=A0AAU0P4H4_9BACT|nr:hypothetical protein QUR79_00460 [Arcobacter sp. DSM 115972]